MVHHLNVQKWIGTIIGIHHSVDVSLFIWQQAQIIGLINTHIPNENYFYVRMYVCGFLCARTCMHTHTCMFT